MNIAATIVNHIRTQLTAHPGTIGLDCNLAHDGHLDSTGMLDLILWVGDTFNISIQNEDLTPENFATPRHIEEFVQRHKNPQVADVQLETSANIASD
jgi:acyl carrier protein